MDGIGQKHTDTEEVEQLDPKGDLVLLVGQRQLLVSSRVLMLACPFFEKMLESNRFQEGIIQPNTADPPTKQVREEKTAIFVLICRVLHYLPVDPPTSVDDLRSLADLCSFYGCGYALSFRVKAWVDSWVLPDFDTDRLQGLLWVAFVFHLRDTFRQVSIHLALALDAKAWKAWEVHPMPIHIKDDTRELYETVKNTIQQHIECFIDEVGGNDTTHIGLRNKVCSQCFRTKPSETKRCGHCGSREFCDYLCTKGVRLVLFKDWLHTVGYWPLSGLNHKSCRNFVGSVPFTMATRFTPCGLDDACPLTGAKKGLIEDLKTILVNREGLKLEDYDDKCEVW